MIDHFTYVHNLSSCEIKAYNQTQHEFCRHLRVVRPVMRDVPNITISVGSFSSRNFSCIALGNDLIHKGRVVVLLLHAILKPLNKFVQPKQGKRLAVW